MKNSKPVTFFEGLIVAVICSFVGSVAYFSFSSIFPDDTTVKLLITMLSLFYIVYLLSRSIETIGRFTVILLWSVITITLWFFSPSIAVYLLIQLLIVWLIRSIYFYSSLLPAAADFLLTLLSVATALWATSQTGNLFLTLWCFFLTQALFALIPGCFKFLDSNKVQQLNTDVDFQRSYRAAEAAVIKLSSHQ